MFRNLALLIITGAVILISSFAAYGEATSVQSKDSGQRSAKAASTQSGDQSDIKPNQGKNPVVLSAVFRSISLSNIIVRSGNTGSATGANLATVPTPEPMSMVLLGSGLAGMAAAIRKRKKRG
jgi:hypothetical protein